MILNLHSLFDFTFWSTLARVYFRKPLKQVFSASACLKSQTSSPEKQIALLEHIAIVLEVFFILLSCLSFDVERTVCGKEEG